MFTTGDLHDTDMFLAPGDVNTTKTHFIVVL